MSIIAVRFQSKKKPDEFTEREYTYYADVPFTVGEIILAPTSKGTAVVRVCRTDMTDADIDDNIRPYIRTIEERVKPNDMDVGK